MLLYTRCMICLKDNIAYLHGTSNQSSVILTLSLVIKSSSKKNSTEMSYFERLPTVNEKPCSLARLLTYLCLFFSVI